MTAPDKSQPLPDLPCACATARRAARLVTQMYSEHLRGFGLEATQFSLLYTLRHQPGRSQTQLAHSLGYDKTTLSRNLKILHKNGWVRSETGPGTRESAMHLTPAGQKIIARAQPRWDRAQQQLRAAMTATEWRAVWKGMRAITRAAQSFTADPV